MGVSRLDSFAILPAGSTISGNGVPFVGPVNAMVTVIVSGTIGTGSIQLQVFDGLGNWVNTGTLITTIGTTTLQLAALGIRASYTAGSGSSLMAVAVFADFTS
jgi:hypothetical protein